MILSVILIILSSIQIFRPYKNKNILFYTIYGSIIIGNIIILVLDLTSIKHIALDTILIITTIITVVSYLYTKLTMHNKKNKSSF